MARLVDIARAAGVSPSLVSRVLNEDPAARATPETRERVRRVADELGYKPHYVARALRGGRTDTIALTVPVLTNPMFSELLHGVQDECEHLGYTLLLARSESLTDSRRLTRLVDEGRVDGFVLQGRDDESATDLARRTDGVPVVLLNSLLPGRPGSVMADDRAGGRVATEHLLANGHRRLALVNGPETAETARRRQQGFVDALAAAGIDPACCPVTHFGYNPASAGTAVDHLLSADRGHGPVAPSAIVVANVNVAVALSTRLRERGLAVPDDVSVVTVHDSWVAECAWPPLTAVRLPLYAMGRRAVLALHSALNGGPPTDEVLADEPILIRRESVRAV